MADVAFDATNSGINTTNNPTCVVAITVGTLDHGVLEATVKWIVTAGGGVRLPSSVASDIGGQFERIDGTRALVLAADAADWGTEKWLLRNPAPGSHSVTLTMNGNTQVKHLGLQSYSLVDHSHPIRAVAVASGTATTNPVTITVPGTRASDMVSGALLSDAASASADVAVNSPATQRWETEEQLFEGDSAAGGDLVASTGSTGIAFTRGSTNFAFVGSAVALKALDSTDGASTGPGIVIGAPTSFVGEGAIGATDATAGGGDVTGTAAVTEALDTAAASGTITVTGSAAITEALDTAAAAGLVIVAMSAAPTEAADTGAASGLITVIASAAPVEAADTSAASAGSTVIASAAPSEADDTAAASGSVPLDVTSSAAPSEANDTAAAAGAIVVIGSAALTEAPDTSAASGLVIVTGSAAATEANDTASASSTVLVNITSTAAVSEQDDSASASSLVLQNIVCAGAATEENDGAAAIGTVGNDAKAEPAYAGGAIRKGRQRARILRTYTDLYEDPGQLVARRSVPITRSAGLAAFAEEESFPMLSARGVWRASFESAPEPEESAEALLSKRGLPSKAFLEWFMREAA
jgi:hypothetical protein